MSLVLVKSENAILYITFNRPDKYNSINREMAMTIQGALDKAAADESIRAVLITGTGKAFGAGQDLGEIVSPDGPPLKDIVSDHYNPIISRIKKLEKPVVAAVNGIAAGASANIALACDIVVAAESAVFIQAFSKIGLIPDSGGTYTLPRLIGYQKASALMMLGDKVTAADAERMGMLYKVFPDESFMEEANKITSKLAAMPTLALAYTKYALQKSYDNSLEEQLTLEHTYQVKAGSTHDYKEGVQAFVEKRKPNFKGQ